MGEASRRSAWSAFWERGRWWKAVLLAVGYLVLFQLVSYAVVPLLPRMGGPTTASHVLVLSTIPIMLGGVLLVIFGVSTGWLRGLWDRQSPPGHGWMWIAVAAVLIFNLLRFASTDDARAGPAWVAAWLLTGLAIGFAEEVLTRGYVIRIVRSAGHREVVVAVVSAAVFALLHSVNLLTGQQLLATVFQLAYTFFFGVCMYLALRVTRTLIAPILLHASTDPSISVQTAYPDAGPLAAIAGLGTLVVIGVGAVALVVLLVSSRTGTARAHPSPPGRGDGGD